MLHIISIHENIEKQIRHIAVFINLWFVTLSFSSNSGFKSVSQQLWSSLTLGFGRRRGASAVESVGHRLFQSHWNAHELQVQLSIPDQQLLVFSNVLARFVEDVVFHLDAHQVLFGGKSGRIHVRHPVAKVSPSVDEMAEFSILEYLRKGSRNLQGGRAGGEVF